MDAPDSFFAKAEPAVEEESPPPKEFVTGEDLTPPLNTKGPAPLQSEEGDAHGLAGCMTCRRRNKKCDEKHPCCKILLRYL